MMLGVGQSERFRARRDEADQAFAWPHGCQVDSLPVQALGGE